MFVSTCADAVVYKSHCSSITKLDIFWRTRECASVCAGALLVPCKHAHHQSTRSPSHTHCSLTRPGLPCVAPTTERVEAMLTGTKRNRLEVLGTCPPCYGEVTVEKVNTHPHHILHAASQFHIEPYTTLCCASDTWLLITCLMVAFLCASAWLSCVCVAMCWHFCATFTSLSTLTAWPAACTP